MLKIITDEGKTIHGDLFFVIGNRLAITFIAGSADCAIRLCDHITSKCSLLAIESERWELCPSTGDLRVGLPLCTYEWLLDMANEEFDEVAG